MRALRRAWLQRGALAWALWPLSLVFGLVAGGRRAAYRHGLVKTGRVDVPVVVVGNVVAGGAGKTPVVMAVVQHLLARGLAPGVISRGYGRRTSDCREVTATSRATEVGDEPLLVARSCGVPVFVAPHRIDAARALLAAYPGTRVIVCDDGLQHLAIARDIEICVFDERGIGNGWLLPAGPLREPWPRAVDLVLRAGEPAAIDGFAVQRRLAPYAHRGDGKRIALAALRGRPLTAIAGVARPEAFFGMLRAQGLHLNRAIALPDHHDFRGDAILSGSTELVCTEKDAVKLWQSRPGAWAVPLELDVDPAFWQSLDGLLDAKLSSAHGPETS